MKRLVVALTIMVSLGFAVQEADAIELKEIDSGLNGDNSTPCTSPDGNEIVFYSNATGGYEAYIMNLDGSELFQVTDFAGKDGPTSWSPDGNRILFYSEQTGNRDIFTINRDGTGILQVTNAPEFDAYGFYSPDGEKIVFSSERGGKMNLWIVNVDGTNPVQLTKGPGPDYCPTWWPNGKILYKIQEGSDYFVYQINADGTGNEKLFGPASTANPSEYSPDGTRILYSAKGAGDRDDVWIANADGSNPVNITNDPTQNQTNASWVGDGKRIVYAGQVANGYNIWMASDLPEEVWGGQKAIEPLGKLFSLWGRIKQNR
ncbi:hypothetical protein ACFL6S_26445 [Candidatus Poribacteria bacterium]